MRVQSRASLFHPLIGAALLLGSGAGPALADSVSGTITLEGSVQFANPIPSIDFSDLTVSSGPGIEATGNGVNCSIDSAGSAPVGALGAYPDSGTLSVGLTISRGGPQPPEGTCLLQLRAGGHDGGAVSAYGTVTVEVSVAEIGGNSLVLVGEDIVVRQSKTQAGLSKDCVKYVKKQMKLRAKCNRTLWMKGGTEGSLKCKEATEEPLDCDPANYAESVVAMGYGGMNQQTDAVNALAIEYKLIPDQVKCQNFLGKASVNFLIRRNQLVLKNCVLAVNDDDTCRAQAVKDSKVKLDLVDKCVTAQMTDGMSGLKVPESGEPCLSQCIVANVLDRKCMKDCLNLELSTLSDLMIGDVPECGNDIVQGGEFCDDGNLVGGDCCSATCTNEPAGSQSCGVGACEVTVAQCNLGQPVTCTPLDPGVEAGNCGDGIDNDCDGDTDDADLDCP
jgi:cysteine-rich repeat protein